MEKNATWKWIILGAAVLGSVAVTMPPSKKVKLGLDLKGGASFVVAFDRAELKKRLEAQGKPADDAAVREARDAMVEAVRNRVDGLGIAEPAIYPQGDDRVVVQMPGIDERKRNEARKTIKSVALLEFRLVHKKSARWTEALLSSDQVPPGFKAVRGGYVRDPAVPEEQMEAVWKGGLRDFGERFLRETLREPDSADVEFMLEEEKDRAAATYYKPYFVENDIQLEGRYVKSARPDKDNYMRDVVALEFDDAGRESFWEITRNYKNNGRLNPDPRGRQLAIVLDGRLRCAPELIAEISDGRSQITGAFTNEEVRRLSNVLRSGSLIVPIEIIEERSVGPTLGRDSVQSGVRASAIAGAGVAVFMALYYLLPGLVANFALLLDLLLLPIAAVLVSGFFGIFTDVGGGAGQLPTLTLPGIAGIALTLGMAVDANVLIFERIREELLAGKKLMSAIAAGFERAFVTILDSNLTTVLAAVIMFWNGSGPVRGYAITLTAGILVSMFTALLITRLVLEMVASHRKVETFRMRQWIRNTRVDFLGKRYWALGLSLAVIVGSGLAFASRGRANFGVDFTGGTSITFQFQEKKPIADIRAALTAEKITDVSLQYQTRPGEGGKKIEELVASISNESAQKMVETMQAKFGSAGYVDTEKTTVGAQVGDEIKRKALASLLWSMVGMVIYITWRFEFGYAIGAIVALVHDALISVGLFCLFGRQLSAPMIAVLLTIIGYSVNDTIVVFDRIREQIRLHPGRKYHEVANEAINQTLSRTLLTSGTTLISVLSLFIFGGGAINDFALMLLIGITVGTYSSIFVATPVALLWHREPKAPAPAPAGKPAPAKA